MDDGTGAADIAGCASASRRCRGMRRAVSGDRVMSGRPVWAGCRNPDTAALRASRRWRGSVGPERHGCGRRFCCREAWRPAPVGWRMGSGIPTARDRLVAATRNCLGLQRAGASARFPCRNSGIPVAHARCPDRRTTTQGTGLALTVLLPRGAALADAAQIVVWRDAAAGARGFGTFARTSKLMMRRMLSLVARFIACQARCRRDRFQRVIRCGRPAFTAWPWLDVAACPRRAWVPRPPPLAGTTKFRRRPRGFPAG